MKFKSQYILWSLFCLAIMVLSFAGAPRAKAAATCGQFSTTSDIHESYYYAPDPHYYSVHDRPINLAENDQWNRGEAIVGSTSYTSIFRLQFRVPSSHPAVTYNLTRLSTQAGEFGQLPNDYNAANGTVAPNGYGYVADSLGWNPYGEQKTSYKNVNEKLQYGLTIRNANTGSVICTQLVFVILNGIDGYLQPTFSDGKIRIAKSGSLTNSAISKFTHYNQYDPARNENSSHPCAIRLNKSGSAEKVLQVVPNFENIEITDPGIYTSIEMECRFMFPDQPIMYFPPFPIGPVGALGYYQKIDVNYTIPDGNPPSVTTNAASAIAQTTATLNGNVTSQGSSALIDRGFYLSSNSSCSGGTQYSVGGTALGSISKNLTGLTTNTTYYFVAYAQNSNSSNSWGFGSCLSFITPAPAQLPPSVTTNAASAIAQTTATLNGNITSQGSSALIDRGFYLSSNSSCSGGTQYSVGGTTLGSISKNLTGLTTNTTYYFVAYAQNSSPTNSWGFGSCLSFATAAPATVPPTVTTIPASGVTASSATLNGQVTNWGSPGSPSSRGFYFGQGTLVSNPTCSGLLNQESVSGFDTNPYSTIRSGLQANTSYLYIAYAINTNSSNSWGFGSCREFTTSAPATARPVVTTNAAGSITSTTATLNGNITSQGSSALIDRGFYLSSNSSCSGGTQYSVGGTALGSISKNLTGLTTNTTYYFLAYAQNSNSNPADSWGFGSCLSFSTHESAATNENRMIKVIISWDEKGIIKSTTLSTFLSKTSASVTPPPGPTETQVAINKNLVNGGDGTFDKPSGNYPSDQELTITATPTDSTVSWSGACSGTSNVCIIPASLMVAGGSVSVTATFTGNTVTGADLGRYIESSITYFQSATMGGFLGSSYATFTTDISANNYTERVVQTAEKESRIGAYEALKSKNLELRISRNGKDYIAYLFVGGVNKGKFLETSVSRVVAHPQAECQLLPTILAEFATWSTNNETVFEALELSTGGLFVNAKNWLIAQNTQVKFIANDGEVLGIAHLYVNGADKGEYVETTINSNYDTACGKTGSCASWTTKTNRWEACLADQIQDARNRIIAQNITIKVPGFAEAAHLWGNN